MENAIIKQPSYFPSAKKTANENGLLQIGTNLFEIGLTSVLTEDEMTDFKKKLGNVCASFDTVFFGNGKEDTRFDFTIGNAKFAYQDVFSMKTGKLRYRVFFLKHLEVNRSTRESVFKQYKNEQLIRDCHFGFNLDIDVEL